MLWVFFGLGAALAAAAMPLLQERYKANSFVLSFLIKITTVVLALPFALYFGLPQDPLFYALVAVTAVLYSISDVIFYRAAAEVGAGVLTRLIPGSVIGTFFLWFLVDPALLDKYLANPGISAGIVATVCFAAFCAMRLKQCATSWQAIRLIWPLLLAATIGPLFSKSALALASHQQAVAGYIFIQALMMLACWIGYWLWRRPVPLARFVDAEHIKAGVVIGTACALSVVLKNYALIYAENPAYAGMLFFTDSVFVLLIYRLLGKPNNSNVLAGMGVVLAAAVLVLLKSFAA